VLFYLMDPGSGMNFFHDPGSGIFLGRFSYFILRSRVLFILGLLRLARVPEAISSKKKYLCIIVHTIPLLCKIRDEKPRIRNDKLSDRG
jgi:hypothetical protein